MRAADSAEDPAADPTLDPALDTDVDVVVVGAGVAGLACARALLTTGRSVLVLEARDRPGGRVLTWRTARGDLVEIGAQVVHLTADPALTELLTWAGIEVVPAPPDIDVHLVRNGVRRSAAEINRDQPPAPWQLARLFDQRTGTVADAVGGLSEPARAAALAWWEQVVGGPPDELAAADVAFILHARSDGEVEIPGGFDRIISTLITGVDVRFGEPVRSIRHRPDGVVVVGGAGSSAVRAAAVVVTVPPGALAAQDVSFNPELTAERDGSVPVLASGDGLVVVLTTHRPPTGTGWVMLLDQPGGLWRTRAGSPVVVGHIKGAAAGRARSFDFSGRSADVLAMVAPTAAGVAEVQIHDWAADRWAAGTFSVPRPDAEVAAARWREPLGGRVFFAGEATATAELRGLVQGALTSGYRAAREVVAALGDLPGHVPPT